MKKIYAIVKSTETGAYHITDKYLGYVDSERKAAIIINKMNEHKTEKERYHFIPIDEFEKADRYKYTKEEIEKDFNDIVDYINNRLDYDGLREYPLGEMCIEIFTTPEDDDENWYISLWKVDVYSEETIDEDFKKVSGYNFSIDNEEDKQKVKNKIIEDLKKIKDDLIAKE